MIPRKRKIVVRNARHTSKIQYRVNADTATKKVIQWRANRLHKKGIRSHETRAARVQLIS